MEMTDKITYQISKLILKLKNCIVNINVMVLIQVIEFTKTQSLIFIETIPAPTNLRQPTLRRDQKSFIARSAIYPRWFKKV